MLTNPLTQNTAEPCIESKAGKTSQSYGMWSGVKGERQRPAHFIENHIGHCLS